MGNYSPTRKHIPLIGTFLVSFLILAVFHAKFSNGSGACLLEQHLCSAEVEYSAL